MSDIKLSFGDVPPDVDDLFAAPQVRDAIERIGRLAPGLFIGGENLRGNVEATSNPHVKRAELALFYELDTPTASIDDAPEITYLVWVDDYELTLVLVPVEIYDPTYSNEDGEFDSYEDDDDPDLNPYGTI